MDNSIKNLIKELNLAFNKMVPKGDYILMMNRNNCYFGNSKLLKKVDFDEEVKEISVQEEPKKDIKVEIWTDGSFNAKTSVVGFGTIIKYDDQEVHFNGNNSDSDFVSMRNVAGEILAALEGLKFAKDKNFKDVTIFYDYMGVETWVTGKWQAKNKLTQYYRDTMRKYIDDGIMIHFKKVEAHAGIPDNEKADKLAKKACGLL